eukprot:702269-Hanusia_phi.AAC.4
MGVGWYSLVGFGVGMMAGMSMALPLLLLLLMMAVAAVEFRGRGEALEDHPDKKTCFAPLKERSEKNSGSRRAALAAILSGSEPHHGSTAPHSNARLFTDISALDYSPIQKHVLVQHGTDVSRLTLPSKIHSVDHAFLQCAVCSAAPYLNLSALFEQSRPEIRSWSSGGSKKRHSALRSRTSERAAEHVIAVCGCGLISYPPASEVSKSGH